MNNNSGDLFNPAEISQNPSLVPSNLNTTNLQTFHPNNDLFGNISNQVLSNSQPRIQQKVYSTSQLNNGPQLQFSNQQQAFIQSSIPQQSNIHPLFPQFQNQLNPFAPSNSLPQMDDPFSGLVPQIISSGSNLASFRYDDDEPIEEKTHVKLQQDQEINLNNIIQLSMKIKRKMLQSSSFSEQKLPILVSLEALNVKSSSRAPIDLMCVIDHSGSMNGEKISLVKNTFNYLLEYLDPSDRLSIVIFDHTASRLVPFLRTTEENKKKILSALMQMECPGGTDINLGMQHAFHALKQRRYVNPITSIFLLSDGLDGRAQHKVKASLAQYGVHEDVTIHTFGYGRDHDPQLMTDIADLRDGNFYFVKQLDQIDEAFVDCLGGLINSIAQNVTIKIKPEQSDALQGVEIVKAYGDASMWTKDTDNQTYITKMAALMSGKQKDYVLEIKLPINKKELQDQEKSIKVASAEAIITGLDNQQIVKKADLYITLLNEVEEMKEEESDDREVMKNFYRVKGALLMDEARKLADSKCNEEAKKLLQNFKEEVANSFLKDEEFIKNMIKDLEKATEYLNPVVFQDYGRQNMYSNQRAQMQQRSDLTMMNCNQGFGQMAMTNEVRAMKSQQQQLPGSKGNNLFG